MIDSHHVAIVIFEGGLDSGGISGLTLLLRILQVILILLQPILDLLKGHSPLCVVLGTKPGRQKQEYVENGSESD
jgi:hypothetical protein